MFFFACKEQHDIELSKLIKNEDFYNNRVEDNYLNSNFWDQFGDYYIQNNQLKKGIECSEKSFRLDSSNYNLSFKLSEFFLKQLSLGKSHKYLENCLRIDSLKTQPYLNLAQLYIFKADYNSALKFINLGLEKNRYLPQGYCMKGVCYKHVRDTVKALSSFKTAIEVDPNYFSAYTELGLMLTMQNDSNAIYYYKNGLSVLPQNIEAWFGLCWAYQSFGKNDLAMNEYKRLILVYPKHIDAKFNLGLIYLEKGEVEMAKEMFHQIIEVEPKHIDALINLYKCYKLEGDNNKYNEMRYRISVIDSTYFL